MIDLSDKLREDATKAVSFDFKARLIKAADAIDALTVKDVEIAILKEREALLRDELFQAREVLHHAAYRTTEMKNMVPRIDAILAEEITHG